MTNRYIVMHNDRVIASIHASSSEQACRRACRMLSCPPDPKECIARLSVVQRHSKASFLDLRDQS